MPGGGRTLRQAQGERDEVKEREHSSLREILEAQAGQLAELGRRVGRLEQQDQPRGDAESGDVGGQENEWRPPRRGHGLPDAGVVTLEQQPDEVHAFGPAAALVTEWRAGGEATRNRVDRAKASARRWELEVAMLRDFHLTLSPGT